MTSATERPFPTPEGSCVPRDSPTTRKAPRVGGHTSDEALSMLSEGKDCGAQGSPGVLYHTRRWRGVEAMSVTRYTPRGVHFILLLPSQCFNGALNCSLKLIITGFPWVRVAF